MRPAVRGARRASPRRLVPDAHTHASPAPARPGALKDNCRAVLVGGRTYGKGLIQSVYELSDTSGLVITVGKYLTPGASSNACVLVLKCARATSRAQRGPGCRPAAAVRPAPPPNTFASCAPGLDRPPRPCPPTHKHPRPHANRRLQAASASTATAQRPPSSLSPDRAHSPAHPATRNPPNPLPPGGVDIDRYGIEPTFKSQPSPQKAEEALTACRLEHGLGAPAGAAAPAARAPQELLLTGETRGGGGARR